MCHFLIGDVKLYNSLLYEVIRNEYRLRDADKVKLQIFYTLLRYPLTAYYLRGLSILPCTNLISNIGVTIWITA